MKLPSPRCNKCLYPVLILLCLEKYPLLLIMTGKVMIVRNSNCHLPSLPVHECYRDVILSKEGYYTGLDLKITDDDYPADQTHGDTPAGLAIFPDPDGWAVSCNLQSFVFIQIKSLVHRTPRPSYCAQGF